MVFANIEYLFLLLLLIPYIVWYIMRRKNSEATLQISDARVYAHAPKSYKNYLLHAPFALRIIALALIIIVLARPQTTDSWQNSEIEGIDIMLAIDVSTSMLAEDLKPNRLFQLLSQNEQRNAYHRHQAELAEPIHLLGRA